MGCFFACFGYSKKRKRRKPGRKVLSGDQCHGRYEPLDSDVNTKLDISEQPISSDSESRAKSKEQSSFRIKKKVSFNLNVKSYEPIPNDEISTYFSESDEETKWGENVDGTANASVPILHFEEDSVASIMESYPSNYRYKNCRDSYDEEYGIKLEEIELDNNDIGDSHDDDCGSSDDDQELSQVEFLEQFESLSMVSAKRVASQSADNQTDNAVKFCALPDQGPKKPESNCNARDRSQYAYSVLNPVENLSQWGAVKARTLPLKCQKENIALEQEKQKHFTLKPSSNSLPLNHKPNLSNSRPIMGHIAVDASLSNWLDSSEKESITKTSTTTAVAATSSKKNLLNPSNSYNREYRRIQRII